MNNEHSENENHQEGETAADLSTQEAAPDLAPENTEAATAGTPEGEAISLETMQAELDRFRDLAARSAADFENYRKRVAREREDALKANTSAILSRLLPVLDNFELGLQAARNEGSEGVVIGFEIVSRQLADFMAGSGVEVIDAVGQPFDPNLHDALGQEASDTVPEGEVIRQTRKGYKLKDRLIRPANVFVSKGPATPAS
ncbi:MAG TPA: nucleotide exchange factor GrpE [Chthoniobacteraceae bacterium]|nr:nucleotide exchange factor GrpE [Chthoniobacteraceae bacterium]